MIETPNVCLKWYRVNKKHVLLYSTVSGNASKRCADATTRDGSKIATRRWTGNGGMWNKSADSGLDVTRNNKLWKIYKHCPTHPTPVLLHCYRQMLPWSFVTRVVFRRVNISLDFQNWVLKKLTSQFDNSFLTICHVNSNYYRST